ncbi:MAG: apolipoprotein N-acyltransferase [Bacteroidota bacterium]|nr:apolipoprotein N-acyltransferase [Bacteroidota bacterium]
MAISRIHVLSWSLLSGVLWALSWPAIGDLTPLAFIAWLPLLHAERLHDLRVGDRRRSFIPYVMIALAIWNLSTSWWFFMVSEPLPTRIASYGMPVLVNTVLMSIPWWLKRIVKRTVGEREAVFGFIFFWLAYEYLDHNWDMQWPWFSLGNVFATRPSWIQWYEYTGILGGTLWILLVTLFLDRAINAWRKGAPKRIWTISSAVAIVLLVVPITLSYLRYTSYKEKGRAMEVVVVQPNIDPYLEKFGGVDPMLQLDHMLDLAGSAITDSTRLVLMPETALQEYPALDMSEDPPRLQGLWENDLSASKSAIRLREFQKAHPQLSVLTGMSSAYLYSPMQERPIAAREVQGTSSWFESFNAALFLDSEGKIDRYHKSKLVAGVELMPFEQYLGPLNDLAIDLGGTSGSLGAQEDRSNFTDRRAGFEVVPAICYESVFGEHIAEHVKNGANMIAIITNDGWWSDSPGYKQHLSFATIRAIETRRSIARSANTGISCFVDQRGNITNTSEWWVPDARRGVVHLNDELTFYVRNGDAIGRVSVLFAALLIMLAWVRVMRRRKKPATRAR